MSSTPPTFLTIPSKPDAPITYTFFPGIAPETLERINLIVFINGLGLPASSWLSSISLLRSALKTCPAILTYDRYLQGLTTSKDPIDSTPGKENGHSFLDIVTDLHAIITQLASTNLSLSPSDIKSGKLNLLLVGASIGVPIIRLFAQHHPSLISGAIFLDSNICNVNYSDILPDPDTPGSDPTDLTDAECNLEQYRTARTALLKMFDLDVKNPENLDRTTGAVLLPQSDGPKLVGGPWLSVVGHDPETFVEMGMERMGTPRSVSRFVNRRVLP
jgi:pimeloyl-ACP methyl ester carboxylesterase